MLERSAGVLIVHSIATKIVQPVYTSGRPMTNAIPIQLVLLPRPQNFLISSPFLIYQFHPTQLGVLLKPLVSSPNFSLFPPRVSLESTLFRGRPSLHTRARQVLALAVNILGLILGLSLGAEPLYELCSKISTRTPLCVGTTDFCLGYR